MMPVRYIVIIAKEKMSDLRQTRERRTAHTYPILREPPQLIANFGKTHHVAPHMRRDRDENRACPKEEIRREESEERGIRQL